MLKFQNITKVFKSDLMAQPFVALKNVSFEIPHGSMVGFLGANGAGKTTSLKIIMDFIRSDEGVISFSEKLGKTKNEVFRNIGFLPERPYFYPNLTGHEFLHFMGTLSEMSRVDIQTATTKWAKRFKIDYALERPLKTYSKGMLQRIGFLATILHEPEFIILDEPLSGLDPIGRKELKDVIVEVHRSGKTVFFSSHIVPDIEEICDRVIFLKEGQLVYDGEVDKLLNTGESSEYLIKYVDRSPQSLNFPHRDVQAFPGNLYSLIIHEKDRVVALSDLLSKNCDLVGIELIKPSLEEIFYKIRTQS